MPRHCTNTADRYKSLQADKACCPDGRFQESMFLIEHFKFMHSLSKTAFDFAHLSVAEKDDAHSERSRRLVLIALAT